MILHASETNANMGLVYGVKHFGLMKWLGDDHIESFKNNWMEVVNLQRTALSNSHLSEILLGLMEHSETMKNDVAEFRHRMTMEVNRGGDYKYLMSIISRHVAA